MAIIGVTAVIWAVVLSVGPSYVLSTTTSLLENGWRFLPSQRVFGGRVPKFSALPPSLISRTLPVGRHDYALSAHGGEIASKLTTSTPRHSSTSTLSSDSVLSDDFRLNGCWNMGSSQGQIGIVLYEPIRPTHITIDHIPSSLSPDIGQAPRAMILWGVIDRAVKREQYAQLLGWTPIAAIQNRSEPSLTGGFNFVPLGGFEYDVHGDFHVQTFPVFQTVVESGIDIGIMVLEVVSNWGADVTCLYRVRIHGEFILANAPLD